VLQSVVVCCSLLLGVAGCCRVLQGVARYCRVLQYIAGCYSVLQGVAVCCSKLQYVCRLVWCLHCRDIRVIMQRFKGCHCNTLQHTETHCNTLQQQGYKGNNADLRDMTWATNTCIVGWYVSLLYVAVCCNVLQCVAVCCSVLQCVAVCCSVLQ